MLRFIFENDHCTKENMGEWWMEDSSEKQGTSQEVISRPCVRVLVVKLGRRKKKKKKSETYFRCQILVG